MLMILGEQVPLVMYSSVISYTKGINEIRIYGRDEKDRPAKTLVRHSAKGRNGPHVLHRKCYGYSHDKNENLQIDESEAGAVRSVFNMNLQGKSIILGIICELEARGIKSPNGKERWCKRGMDVMLKVER